MSASRHVTTELVCEALSEYTIGWPATRDDAVPAAELRDKVLGTLVKRGLRRACSYQQLKAILGTLLDNKGGYAECRRAQYGRKRCVQYVRFNAAAAAVAAVPVLDVPAPPAHGRDAGGPEDAAATAPAPPLAVDVPLVVPADDAPGPSDESISGWWALVMEPVARPAGAIGVIPVATGAALLQRHSLSPIPVLAATTTTAGAKRYRSPPGTPDARTRRRLFDDEPADDDDSMIGALPPLDSLAGAITGTPPAESDDSGPSPSDIIPRVPSPWY